MAKTQYFLDIEEFFERNDIKKPKGCSEVEISTLEKTVGFELPEAFKEYLRFMGKDYHGVMQGTNCFKEDIAENTKYLPALLEENKLNYHLPENYLAFFCHQGYIMGWFELPKVSDNPMCYFFSEGTTEHPQEYGNFEQFMTTDILSNARIELALKQDKKWWQFWK